MRNRTQLGRADLLACLQVHGEEQLEALAVALGYGREIPKTQEPTQQNESAQPHESSITQTLKPGGTVTTPKARFHRVVIRRQLKPGEIVRDKPDWFKPDDPYREEVLGEVEVKPPSHPPLMRWSRLWPFLKTALGAQQSTLALDVPRIVELLARGQIPRSLPYKQHKGWANSCQIIVDYAEPLLPFWTDFNHLHQRLRRLRGDQGLTLIAFPNGDLGGRCWSYSKQGWHVIESYPVPASGTPILVLSDLGCIDSADVRRRQWRRLGLRLQRADCHPVVLMPCPPRWWDRDLTKLFYPVCWDRSSHPPQRLGTRYVQPAPSAQREQDESAERLLALQKKQDEGAERLLALLAPAIRIEPALLRAVRHSLSARDADVGSEAAAWNHPNVHATPLAFYYDNETIEHYREKFQEQDETQRGQVAARIVAYHAHLSPAIVLEEKLLLADLANTFDADAQRFIERIVSAQHDSNSALAAPANAWAHRMTQRQHKNMWRNDTLAAAWAKTNLPRLQAGENLKLPGELNLARVSWVLREGRAPKRYTLRQRGRALFFEADSRPTTGSELDAPGSPLTEIRAAAPVVDYQTIEESGSSGDKHTQPLEQAMPLPASGRLRIGTDLEEFTVDSISRPDWAEGMGRDEYGLYVDFRIEGVHQRLRWIVPGEFVMGSPEDEVERGNDERQHQVVLSRGYWLADTACTQALWRTVIGDNPSSFQGEDRPVENVSWKDVQEFIERLNALVPEGGFRLPTEAEWEYACRAGSTSPFWFGDQITPEQVNYRGDYPYAGGPKGLYRKETVDVQALPCNSWGLYQMHGNVWEWCQDWYGDYARDTVVDPTGPAEGGLRVLRGGGWLDFGRHARSAQRNRGDPGDRYRISGFRLARGQVSGG